jgi:hypothetical protein
VHYSYNVDFSVSPRAPKRIDNLNTNFLPIFVVALAGCTLIGYDFSKIAEIPSISAPLLPFICTAPVTALFTLLLFIAALSQVESSRQKIKFVVISIGAYKQLAVVALAISISLFVLSFSHGLMRNHIPNSSLFESTGSLVCKAAVLFLIGQQFGVMGTRFLSEDAVLSGFLWPVRKFKGWTNLSLGGCLVFVGWAMLLTGSASWKYGPVIEDPRFAIPGAMLVFVGTYLMSACWDLNKSE